jgi:hypothetical protein
MMRSTWFPRKVAAYVTVAQLDENVTVERDSTFASNRERKRTQQLKEKSRMDADEGLALAEDPVMSALSSLGSLAPDQAAPTPLFSKMFMPEHDKEPSLLDEQGNVVGISILQ